MSRIGVVKLPPEKSRLPPEGASYQFKVAPSEVVALSVKLAEPQDSAPDVLKISGVMLIERVTTRVGLLHPFTPS